MIFEIYAQLNMRNIIGEKEEWKIDEDLNVLQQPNFNDCGVYALIFAKFILKKKK